MRFFKKPDPVVVQASPFLPLATSYVCVVCEIIQDKVPRGVCQRCGSSMVLSVSDMLKEKQNEIRLRMEAAKQKKLVVLPKRREEQDKTQRIKKNLSAFLTMPE